MNSRKRVVFLVVLIIVSGFGREFIMKNINWVVKYLTQGGGYWSQKMFDPLLALSLGELEVLKWVLTIGFTIYFYSLTRLTVKLIFADNKYFLSITTMLFLSLVGISFLLTIIAWLSNSLVALYPIIRSLMGIAQSFVPLMVLYLIFKFLPQKKHN